MLEVMQDLSDKRDGVVIGDHGEGLSFTAEHPGARRFSELLFSRGIGLPGFKDSKGQHCTINSASFWETMAGKRWRFVPLELGRIEGSGYRYLDEGRRRRKTGVEVSYADHHWYAVDELRNFSALGTTFHTAHAI